MAQDTIAFQTKPRPQKAQKTQNSPGDFVRFAPFVAMTVLKKL
jgi:hypothetical protein